MGVQPEPDIADAVRTDMGEIDTSAPFQSVKAAVSMFGEGAFSPHKATMKRSREYSAEKVLAKETQLHVAGKELNRLKEQLNNCETTRVQALAELEKAKRTVDELTRKLKTINESRESAVQVTETAKLQTKQLGDVCSIGQAESGGSWNHELESAREHYAAAFTELDAAKQELRKIKQDFEASMDAKDSAFEKEVEAKKMADINSERATQLSKEIAAVQESLVHVKSASMQAKQEELNILDEKNVSRQSHRLALEETEKKLLFLRKEFDPETAVNLEDKLAETTAEIGSVQKEMENARASDLDLVKTVTTELDGAKGVLQRVVEEESSLRSLLESVKLELENVKSEHLELKEKEAETELVAGNFHINLQRTKAELEKAIAGDAKARAACDDLVSTLQQLSSESDDARKNAEAMKKTATGLRKESEATRLSLEETEQTLDVALRDAEAAKAAEADALNAIKILSEKANVARSSTSESDAKITISAEEFESLSKKVGESQTLAEMKVAAAMAQVEAVRASENEAVKKIEVGHKEIEEMKLATEDALKRAEMAEAARKAVQGEMRRWREREQKKAAETASRILSEKEMSKSKEAPQAMAQPPVPDPTKKNEGTRKTLEKTPTIKRTLIPTFSGIFNRKKSNVAGGSPSYLPGEKAI